MPRFLTLILILSLLTSCAPASSGSGLPFSLPAIIGAGATLPWWRDAVFYEIFVRSFNDTNGDGIGDFNGITQKLDYLQSLGVTALWLMPIHPSPSYHGYDVLNYYAVNPQYGTLDDFKRLLSEAHSRGMKVIIDLVLNHTSSQHPWFIDANSSPQSPYRDWYLWSSEYPGNHWYAGKSGYYYGFFWSEMPDLNYNNPAVTAQMEKVSAFWLNEVGVDGFRIDAAKHLVEEGLQLENTASNHAWLSGYYAAVKKYQPEAYTLGEIYGAGALVTKIYKNELDHIFNFEISSGAINSALGESNSGMNSALKFAVKDNPTGDFATFLSNHDQNRVMSVLNGDVNKAKVAAALLLTGPGTPFLYYGEEIGMRGKKPDEDIRRPMQWNADSSAGFSSGVPWQPLQDDYAKLNVASQEKDPNSLLNHYRTLLALRKQHPALRSGSFSVLETDNPSVYAILRKHTSETLLVLINLSHEPVTHYALGLTTDKLPNGTYQPETLFGASSAGTLQVTGKSFQGYIPFAELPPSMIYIFRLK